MKCFFKTTMLLAAVIIFSLQSCTTGKAIDRTQLEGYWTLQTLNGEEVANSFSGSIPHFEFNFSDSTISGNGGCNVFGGNFTLTDDSFSAPNLISTMRACLNGNKEPQFLSALSTPDLTISVDKDGFLTFSKGNEVLLKFQKAEKPADKATADLVNAENLTGKWTLTSIADGEIGTLFKDKAPTMEIETNGKVFGHSGCNTYRTVYELNENTITFKPAAATMMACPSLEGEGKFLAYLNTPLQAGLNGDKLTFFRDGNVVLEFTKSAE